ncbi:DUF2971 domain-containing protein [Pseudomonas sp. 2FE]|uniref:DUF2971 domain-containing protein n=1 Tax=Pseudomonas sp. 2FE TaxID=2502190 RepID=UPI0010F97A72|nr:DUF2971 domain-containing protein [Pseudomonas sp. 2FE]
MSPPLRLYKYEAFTAQSLQNLKDQLIYFGSPLAFNDPYDCALSPRIKEPTDVDVERVRSHYLAKPEIENRVRREFETASPAALRHMLLRIGQNTLDDMITKFLSQRGVTCFSEKRDSLLMWSHYGDHCKGFCLEFSTSADPFHKIKKVRYTQDMPVIDVVPMLCDEDYDPVVDLYCTKAIDWAYEHEWRAIHSQAGTAYRYPSESLTGIYLGPDMPFTAFEIIALVLAGQNEHVQLWQGSRSKSNFSVEFRPVTYTSHLEAKRLGLLGTADA